MTSPLCEVGRNKTLHNLKFMSCLLTYGAQTPGRGLEENLMWLVVLISICLDPLVTAVTSFDFLSVTNFSSIVSGFGFASCDFIISYPNPLLCLYF